MLQLSEMQLKSSMKTPQNHFDSKCMIKETTLGMVVDGQWMIMFKGSKFILKKLLKDIFHTRKKRTVNIPDDRFLQLTQQILDMLKSMVIIFQQARFQSSRQPIVHGSMDGCMADQGEGEKGLLHRTW